MKPVNHGPYDPLFSGLIRKRHCTDAACCTLFVATVAAYMVVGILAWLFGDPRHVLFPRNSTGMFCGTGMNANKPSMFYLDILKCVTTTNTMAAALNGRQCPTTQVCVKKCPSRYWMLPEAAYEADAIPMDFFPRQYCDPNFDLAETTLTVQDILDQELCPSFYIPSEPALGRCLPTQAALRKMPSNFTLPGKADVNETVTSITTAIRSLITGYNTKAVGVRIFEDFASSWYWILLGMIVAMVVSLVFLLLLRYLAFVLVWVLILGVLAMGGYGIFRCYIEYANFSKSKMTIGDLRFKDKVSVYFQVKETWLAFLIVLCVVEFILLVVLSCIRRSVVTAVSLIEESSRAVGCMMSTLVYPLFTFVLVVVCVSYWGITALYLATSGIPVYRVVSLNNTIMPGCSPINGTQNCRPQTFDSSIYPDCPAARCLFYKYDEEGFFQRNLVVLQLFNVFAFLWCVNFVIALGQSTLAGVFSSYYWAFTKPTDIPAFPLSHAFIRTLRYHVGSLAIGSLTLLFFQLPRILMEYLDRKCRDSKGSCARFLMTCFRPCSLCLEGFLKFVSRNAFIAMAMYGENFAVSAQSAYALLLRNISRVVVLDGVADMLLFFCKLVVVTAVGVPAFFFFSGGINMPEDAFQANMLNYYWVPSITVIVAAYLIAQGFFSVYSMCIDTLYMCFMEDLERNDGSVQKPYVMSRNLMRILRKTRPGQSFQKTN
ncbi:choline transporter-like protein 4 [Osmerus mordax]|uniref:choline transporter-like protein 4 n=1 Tax=Osmerus mordax TaxID=8014 RepID=UPI003510350D